MFRHRPRVYALAIGVTAIASPFAILGTAHAGTLDIVSGVPAGWQELTLEAGDFTRYSEPGDGTSVIEDGTKPLFLTPATCAFSHCDGRFNVLDGKDNPDSRGWWDAQDIRILGVNVGRFLTDRGRRIVFAFTDVADTRGGTWRPEIGGLTLTTSEGWDDPVFLEVGFGEGEEELQLIASARDSYSVQAFAAPVPLPAGLGLLLTALAGLFGVRKMRRSTSRRIATAARHP